jgi:hypothetical protein
MKLAEMEGVHPLFLYPEFRFRSRDRGPDTDRTRMATIHESVRFAILSVEREFSGLRARLEHARKLAALLTNPDNQNGQDADKADRGASVELRLLAPERRIDELKDHLVALQRIESAVKRELNS